MLLHQKVIYKLLGKYLLFFFEMEVPIGYETTKLSETKSISNIQSVVFAH